MSFLFVNDITDKQIISKVKELLTYSFPKITPL